MLLAGKGLWEPREQPARRSHRPTSAFQRRWAPGRQPSWSVAFKTRNLPSSAFQSHIPLGPSRLTGLFSRLLMDPHVGSLLRPPQTGLPVRILAGVNAFDGGDKGWAA